MDKTQALQLAELGGRYIQALVDDDYLKALTLALKSNQLDLGALTPAADRQAMVQIATGFAASTSINMTSVLERLALQWAVCNRCGQLSKRNAYWVQPEDGFSYPDTHVCVGCQNDEYATKQALEVKA
jgi:hypothetical protein